MTEIGVTDVNGNLKTLYKLDDAGNKVESIYLWGKVKCKFDSLGHKIEMKSYDEDDKLTSTWIQKYEGEYLIEKFSLDPQGNVTNRSTYEYSSFDDKGNWLKKVIHTDGEDSIIIVREIEYYSD